MMKEDEPKKILLNYIYLSRQHAGGKDQVAINLLEGICKNKDMGACVVLCYDYAKAYLEQIAPGVTVITVKPPKKESELVRLLDIERVNTWIVTAEGPACGGPGGRHRSEPGRRGLSA